MRFFSLEGSSPAVLRDDGKAFLWDRDTSDWGEISANELRADPSTPELTEGEFKIRALVSGADPSTVPEI
jgi:hypothetical protein